jgi:hypothetical protein
MSKCKVKECTKRADPNCGNVCRAHYEQFVPNKRLRIREKKK